MDVFNNAYGPFVRWLIENIVAPSIASFIADIALYFFVQNIESLKKNLFLLD